MKHLLDPTIIIALLIAIFSVQFSKLGTWIIFRLETFSSVLKQKNKILTWKFKKKVVTNSKSQGELLRAVVRTYFLLSTFSLLCIIYGLAILIDPTHYLIHLPKEILYFITAPLYCFEILWLLQREYTNYLIRASSRKKKRQQ